MIKLFQVDAFTETPFKGNPAGVCILGEPQTDEWMMHLAGEMNLSETAFLLPKGNGYNLRWFTPKTEVSLCGHATLASAHILWEEKAEPEDKTIVFNTRSGELYIKKEGKIIEMDFPARIVKSMEKNEALNESLNISPVFTGKYQTEGGDVYLLQVESDEVIKGMNPDYKKLLSIPGARAVIVTSKSSDQKYNFVSRFFAPAVGVNEDPVTGSAHCYLTPYWGAKLGKKEMVGYQASKRSGVIRCKWIGDRVLLGGNAVTVFKAELFV